MRITSQMLALTSRETGIPLAQGSLLDALNNQNNSSDLLEALNKNQNAKKASAMQRVFHELGNTSQHLSRQVSRLMETGEASLFGKAEDNKETGDILSGIKDMIEDYNKTLELLKEADGSLNNFYYRELKNAAAANAEQLKEAGIIQNKDGSLTVDEKILDNTDYDTLRELFGSESDFITKTDYISGRVSENAQANIASVSNQYNVKGVSYSDVLEANQYDFFG